MFVIIIVSVFIIELIMHYVTNLFHFSAFIMELIDASALTLLIFPVVYFFSLRPMEVYIGEVVRERETIRENYGKLEKIQRGTIHALSQIAEMRERIRKGPAIKETSSAVKAATAARKVM